MSFLQDRVRKQYEIPRLATIIRQQALTAVADPPHHSLPLSNTAALQLDRQQLVG